MLLYPLSEMTEGIFYEHFRLYGMLVGVTAITLLVLVFRHDRQGWVEGLAAAIFVMVCVQGLMGGLRVTGHLTDSQTDVTPSTTLAIAHGMFGQFTFAAFVVLALVSSRAWRRNRQAVLAQAAGDRQWAIMLVARRLVLQLFLGVLPTSRHAAARRRRQARGPGVGDARPSHVLDARPDPRLRRRPPR